MVVVLVLVLVLAAVHVFDTLLLLLLICWDFTHILDRERLVFLNQVGIKVVCPSSDSVEG